MSLRVTMIASGLRVGGAELQLTQLARDLIKRAWAVDVISMQAGGHYQRVLEEAGANVIVVPAGRLTGCAAVRRLAQVVCECDPDLVYTQAFRANLWGRTASLLNRHPTVASLRVTYSRYPAAYYPVERMLARWTTRLVTPSEATSRHLVERVGIPATKVTTIPNGVDTAVYTTAIDRASIRRSWGIGDSDVLVVCVARLVTVKNHAGLIRAVARASLRTPMTLVCVGTGPLRDELEVRAAKTPAHIRFVGELPPARIPSVLGAADIVALMSDVEGMPNAVLEAMACARPVVATATDGAAEVIVDGDTGVLVPPGDETAMGDALAQLAADAQRRRRLGVRASRFVRERHTVGANTDAHIKLFEEVLGGR